MPWEKQVVFLQHILSIYVVASLLLCSLSQVTEILFVFYNSGVWVILYVEGVSTLIGFKGPDQPPLGPFLYLFQAQVPTSALGLSVLAAVRQIDSRIQQKKYRITSLAQKYTIRFCYFVVSQLAMV